MPRAKSKIVGYSPAYVAMSNEQHTLQDTNDCAVKAVAAVTSKPYKEVHALMANLGRKARKGTNWWIINAALDAFGFKLEQVCMLDIIHQYPGIHGRVLRSITTHHPERFNKVWRDGNAYILDCRSHVAGIVNGVNHDWTKGRATRVRRVFKITKIGTSLEQELVADAPEQS